MEAIYIPRAYQDAVEECGSQQESSWEFSLAQEQLHSESKRNSSSVSFVPQDQSDDDELEQLDSNDADEERIKNKSCSIKRNPSTPFNLI